MGYVFTMVSISSNKKALFIGFNGVKDVPNKINSGDLSRVLNGTK
jgi:hypothetical protein